MLAPPKGWRPPPEGLAPHLGKILDLPLGTYARGGTSLLFGIMFAKNCIKMNKNWTEKGVHVPRAPRSENALETFTATI